MKITQSWRDEFVLIEEAWAPDSTESLVELRLRWCREHGLTTARILFQDRWGKWDELLHDAGRYVGIAHYRAKTLDDAIAWTRRCAA